MANFPYTRGLRDLGRGTINLHTGGDDIRVALVMTNTTCDTEEDAATFAGFTTIDEFDGSGYSSPGSALANEIFNEDTANNRGEFDADDLTFTSLSAGTRSIQAAIVYKFVTNLNASTPLFFIDSGFGPTPANGGNIVLAWNAQGIAQLTATQP